MASATRISSIREQESVSPTTASSRSSQRMPRLPMGFLKLQAYWEWFVDFRLCRVNAQKLESSESLEQRLRSRRRVALENFTEPTLIRSRPAFRPACLRAGTEFQSRVRGAVKRR